MYLLVILGFVGVHRTGGIALVLVHDQVMVTAGAEIGAILT